MRPLEHHGFAVVHRLMQVQRRVGHEWPQPGPDATQVGEHILPLHVGVPDEAVTCRDVLAHGVGERTVEARIRQVSDAHAPAADLVLVGRADTARGRADLALASPGFRQHIQLAAAIGSAHFVAEFPLERCPGFLVG